MKVFHLAGNMLFLWILGNNIEDVMEKTRFIFFYFICDIVVTLGQTMEDPNSETPMVEISGAISCAFGAYLLLYPHVMTLVLIPLGFFYIINQNTSRIGTRYMVCNTVG